jgi:predicted alpha/beta-hydrolase family hydrolase
MQSTDVAPETAMLVDELSTRQDISDAAMQAARRVRELERAVRDLRTSLSAASGAAMDDTERRAHIARLLSEVTLFRIALADRA